MLGHLGFRLFTGHLGCKEIWGWVRLGSHGFELYYGTVYRTLEAAVKFPPPPQSSPILQFDIPVPLRISTHQSRHNQYLKTASIPWSGDYRIDNFFTRCKKWRITLCLPTFQSLQTFSFKCYLWNSFVFSPAIKKSKHDVHKSGSKKNNGNFFNDRN